MTKCIVQSSVANVNPNRSKTRPFAGNVTAMIDYEENLPQYRRHRSGDSENAVYVQRVSDHRSSG